MRAVDAAALIGPPATGKPRDDASSLSRPIKRARQNELSSADELGRFVRSPRFIVKEVVEARTMAARRSSLIERPRW